MNRSSSAGTSEPSSASETTLFFSNLRHSLWLLCVPAWLFGAVERGVALFSHSSISLITLTQAFTAVFFLGGWLLLKPSPELNSEILE